MSDLPENDPAEPEGFLPDTTSPDLIPPEHEFTEMINGDWVEQPQPAETATLLAPPAPDIESSAPPLFWQFSQPRLLPPTRIPNFADLGLILVMVFAGWLGASSLLAIALHYHLWRVNTLQQALNEIHYTLGSQAIWYLISLGGCLLLFPAVWHKSFFAGVQWNWSNALRKRWRLLSAVGVCFAMAMVDGMLLPGPQNTPIDEIFRKPGAAWLLFAFGTTPAPFFEELAFRGFLLPAFCTAFDWSAEHIRHRPAPWPDAEGNTPWSLPAMISGSIIISIPFALMHAAQTGYSWGPFLLLVCVSLVLCLVRLSTRSLAASVLVHSSYNFLLFSLMLAGTDGFKHLDKM